MIAAGSPIHATAAGPRLNDGTPMRITPIPATLPFEEIVERVRAIDPQMVMGYPSVLARLAAEQTAGRLDIHPAVLTSSAENLTPAVRAQLEGAFGVPVTNLFGSTEGLVGVSEPGEEPLAFASDGCIVEPVDDRHQPVAPGQPSAAVLVTNLYNRAQPLIRYRMDDRFVQAPPSPHHGHFRAVVDGRASDTLRWGEVVVHPLTVTNELIHTPAIVDHVVRQTPAGVTIDVVAVADVDLTAVGSAIQRDLAAAGFAGAEVTLRRIDDIGRDRRTGKVARIVPLGR
jgi:phenylacetate-coenzyme A ligase PaaK-like adenylate-forming protein